MQFDLLLGLLWRSTPAFSSLVRAKYARLARRLAEDGAAVIGWLRTSRQRRRSRAELTAMDEQALHDLGWSRAQAMLEAAKPFWRA